MLGVFAEGNLSYLPEGCNLTQHRTRNIKIVDGTHADLDILGGWQANVRDAHLESFRRGKGEGALGIQRVFAGKVRMDTFRMRPRLKPKSNLRFSTCLGTRSSVTRDLH